MDTQHIRQFIADLWDDSIVPALVEYIRIPNKSPAFEPDWAALGHMRAAAKHLQHWVAGCGVRGLTQRIVALPGRTPVLLCVIEAVRRAMRCSTATTTSNRSSRAGRRASARGRPCFATADCTDAAAPTTAMRRLRPLRPSPPCRIRVCRIRRCVVLIEGCEESGSYDLPAYMDTLASEIGTPDLVVCLDAECGNYDQLWLTTSLRGLLAGVLTVRVLTEGVHSGAAGGIVPSSFRLLRQLIERVENARTGELHSVLQARFRSGPPPGRRGRRHPRAPSAHARFPWAGGTGPGDVSDEKLVLANTWQPSLAVVGLGGAPALADAGNTLRPATAAKLVFRLPPTLDAERAASRVRDLLERDPPHGADVAFELEHPMSGWQAPARAPWLTAALEDASNAHFGAPLASMGCGGTIPFMKMLGERYPGVQFAVTGVLGPHSNAHGPNEFLDIATGKRCDGLRSASAACAGGSAADPRLAGSRPSAPRET